MERSLHVDECTYILFLPNALSLPKKQTAIFGEQHMDISLDLNHQEMTMIRWVTRGGHLFTCSLAACLQTSGLGFTFNGTLAKVTGLQRFIEFNGFH